MEIEEIRKGLDVQTLKTLFRSHGGEWGEVNLAGIRSGMSSKEDYFDDLLILCIDTTLIGDLTAPMLIISEGTTDPSKWWTINPVTYQGVKGAAHLCKGYYKDMWRIGTHAKGTPFAHEALVAADGVIRFWRDKNMNALYDPDTDVIQEAPNSWIGINRHRGGLDDPRTIGLYGAGCQVHRYHKTQQEEIALIKNSVLYKTYLDAMQTDPDTKSPTFGYLLLEKEEL